MADLSDFCEPASGRDVEVVVDVSNVCFDQSLDTTRQVAAWSRLERLLEAWSDWEHGFPQPIVRLVADESLTSSLSSADRRALKDAVATGYAEVHSYADEVILDVARQHDCVVLSNDQFIGHRRERPWINGNDRQFVHWTSDDSGIVLELVEMSARTDYSLSRAEERDEIKARGIDERRGRGVELLDAVYRCDNLGCPRRALRSSNVMTPPKRGPSGDAVCPGCSQPLTRVGSLLDTAVLKVTGAGDSSSIRVPLEEGAELILGRSSDRLSLDAVLDSKEVQRISQRHVVVGFDGSRVWVSDERSTNGTTIQRWSREVGDYETPTRIVPGNKVTVRPRDRVVLAGVLTLERSGRRFPYDIASARSEGTSGQRAQGSKTRVSTDGESK